MLNKMRLLTPGPTPLPENVRLALAQDMIHHRKPGFKAILAEVQEGLQYLFGTSQTVAVMTCSGTGAMTAAVGCLFAPGEKVLVVEAGKFGERWREIAAARGLSVVVLEFPWGEAADPARVREALDRHPDAAGLLVQASETSTGALHPVREIAALTRERDTLLVVDGISAVGISPLSHGRLGPGLPADRLAEGAHAAPGPGLRRPEPAGQGQGRPHRSRATSTWICRANSTSSAATRPCTPRP